MDTVDDVPEKAIELGTTYFKNENFTKAKEIFKKALQLVRSYEKSKLLEIREKYGLSNEACSNNVNSDKKVYHPRYVRILDNLSATYEKLEQLDIALKYARKMIEVEPYNLKCYIRCGKVLQRLHKDFEALKLYNKAISKICNKDGQNVVNVSSRFLPMIHQQRRIVKDRLEKKNKEDLTDSVNSDPIFKRKLIDPIHERQQLLKRAKRSGEPRNLRTNKINFIELLPPEILPLILRWFSTKELLQLTMVCKVWKRIIMKAPRIFHSFLLNNITYKNTLKFTKFCYTLNFRHSLDFMKYSSKMASEEMKSLELLFSSLQKCILKKLALSVPNCNTAHFSKISSNICNLTQNVEELSLVLSHRQDKPYELDILENFCQLKRLEVLFESSVIPINGRTSRSSERLLDRNYARNLESFRLICNKNKVKTFPFVAYLKSSQTRGLSKLCITGVTLDDETSQFGWLSQLTSLKEIWLENNKNSSFALFMKSIKDSPIFGSLYSLTFREDSITARYDMEEAEEQYFYKHNLRNLTSLDIMGTSISGLGLLRLSSYLDGSKMKRINFGDCPFIKIQKVSTVTNISSLSLSDLFTCLPQIEEVIIAQLGTLDDEGITCMKNYIDKLPELKRIDLSLNPSVTGVAIYDLVRTLKTFRDKPLEYLNVNGCSSVSHITISTLKSQGLVREVECVYEREVWRVFGNNSFKL